MHLPDKMTIGEAFGPAMTITEQVSADEYFGALVDRQMRVFGHPRDRAEADTRANLGYYAGYYDSETRERVERLFRCAHPVFGAISETGAPTPEQAFSAGMAWAQRS